MGKIEFNVGAPLELGAFVVAPSFSDELELRVVGLEVADCELPSELMNSTSSAVLELDELDLLEPQLPLMEPLFAAFGGAVVAFATVVAFLDAGTAVAVVFRTLGEVDLAGMVVVAVGVGAVVEGVAVELTTLLLVTAGALVVDEAAAASVDVTGDAVGAAASLVPVESEVAVVDEPPQFTFAHKLGSDVLDASLGCETPVVQRGVAPTVHSQHGSPSSWPFVWPSPSVSA